MSVESGGKREKRTLSRKRLNVTELNGGRSKAREVFSLGKSTWRVQFLGGISPGGREREVLSLHSRNGKRGIFLAESLFKGATSKINNGCRRRKKESSR